MKEPAQLALHWMFGLPLVAGLITWGLLPATPWWLQLILAIAALAVLGYLLQRSSNWLFGPVLIYELVRQTRSPRVPLLRIGYALILLLAMFLVYLRYTPGTGHERTLAALAEGTQVEPNQRAEFAATFFNTFLALQFAILTIFTPAVVSGTLASDKQSGTLDLLLTTDLNNREIILGKLGSQLAYLLLLLLTGLPVLSILQMLGGVDPNLVFITFVGTLMSVITIGSASMLSAVLTSRARESLQIAYGFALAHLYFTFYAWIILMGAQEEGRFGTVSFILLGVYTLYSITVSSLSLWFTFRWLRPTLRDKDRRPVPRPRAKRTRPARRPPPPRYKRPERQRPPLGDRAPMVWKELYYERGLDDYMPGGLTGVNSGQGFAIIGAVLVVLVLFIMLVSSMTDSTRFREVSNGLVLYLGVPLAQIVLIVMSLRAAATFSRERETQTFDSLLTTALTDSEILGAKWLACLWSVRYWAIPVGLIYLLALCTGGLSPLAFPLVLLAVAIHTAFVVNLGIYCSVRSASTLRSTIGTVVTLVLIVVGHWLLALFSQPFAFAFWGRSIANGIFDIHLWGLTLPWNLAAVSFYHEDMEATDFLVARLYPGLIGLAVYAGLAALLFHGIVRRFRLYRD